MTSSPEPDEPGVTAAGIDAGPGELPPGLPAMWRLCRLGYQHEPALLSVSVVLAVASAVPDALLALWLALLGDGLLHSHRRTVTLAAVGLGLSATATWFLRTVGTRVQRRFRDKVTIALESHVAGLLATVPTIAHQEQPGYLDRLSVLRDQIFVLDHMYMSLFTTAGWIVRLVLTIGLLMSVNPALALLAGFALPTVATSSWRPAVERAAQERGARHDRLARHLFLVATTASAGKEVRLNGLGRRLAGDRRQAWERWYGPVAAARRSTAAWHAAAWSVFGAAYVSAVALIASGPHRRSVAGVLLVLAAGARLSAYLGGAVGEIGFLRGTWIDGSRRLVWLERYAASLTASADQPAPERITAGIRLEHVTFAYPGTSRLVLDDVDLFLPAGTVVAIVGDNGAGKTTLVKLLCRLYEPTAGRILVDGEPLSAIEPSAWRACVSGTLQDFFRFELPAAHSVGVGDLGRLDDRRAVGEAVDRAGAGDVVDALPEGLDTQLGRSWPGGAEISFGQWQKLAVARGFMREQPLLLVLDEPTAALDAETEHALFERYASVARRASDRQVGRITVLVSHRFSTVRMADLIVVMDGARVAEVGSHGDLMARRGVYADLYGVQAAGYR